MAKTVRILDESDSGRNQRFVDTRTGREMTRPDFVRAIEAEQYPDYHVRVVNGVKTPVSNPDRSEENSLG